MEWTELILNFVGQVAWPVVVLVLGLFFRKPLAKLLTVNGPLKSISAGSVMAEWDISAGIDKAQEALDSESTSSGAVGEVQQGSDGDSDSAAGKTGGSGVIESQVGPNLRPRVWTVSDEAIDFAHKSPRASIQWSAGRLAQSLFDSVGIVAKSRGVGLGMAAGPAPQGGAILNGAVNLAETAELLSPAQIKAARELVSVLDRVSFMNDQLRLDPDTAIAFERTCNELAYSAKENAKRLAAAELRD